MARRIMRLQAYVPRYSSRLYARGYLTQCIIVYVYDQHNVSQTVSNRVTSFVRKFTNTTNDYIECWFGAIVGFWLFAPTRPIGYRHVYLLLLNTDSCISLQLRKQLFHDRSRIAILP